MKPLKKTIKDLIHYVIALIGIFITSWAFMKYYPPLDFDFIYLIKFFLVTLIVFIVVDKLVHKYYLMEGK